MARCPECDAAFDLEEEDLEEGEFVDCPECGVELEVAGMHPLRLDLVHEDFEEDEFENGDFDDVDDEWD
jgi:alpha-aminoadipate carrier protein LysW